MSPAIRKTKREPLLISFYDLLDTINGSDALYSYIEYEGKIYYWTGTNYVNWDEDLLTERLPLYMCKEPKIRLLDYVMDIQEEDGTSSVSIRN